MIKNVSKEEINVWIKKIEDIHFEITGNQNDMINRGILEHILFECLRNNKYKNKEKFATFILMEIAINHPFWDGNKRTALLSALKFLRTENENTVKLYPQSWEDRTNRIVRFMEDVAQREYEFDDVLKVIKDRFKLNK
ncbi:MAG: Fic family protein [Nanoarchaeota archaeon]|nr:Fic family protein [Nanoarchaeota archaeon]MBU4124188.1 Fic family protein [Nanoarchaeota archaeon]